MTRRFFRSLAPLVLPIAVASPLVSAVAIGACSSDPVTTTEDAGRVDGSSSGDTGSGGDDSGSTKDGASSDAPSGDGSCAPALPPIFDGGNPCGALDFGVPAAAFGPVLDDAGYVGGSIPAGIYDAVLGERSSKAPGSWRETFVVDGAGKFTRIRQLHVNADAGPPGPIQYRAGTYAVIGNEVKFTYTCAVVDGGAVDGGSDQLPFDVLTTPGCNEPVYRYGAFGFRITFRRR